MHHARRRAADALVDVFHCCAPRLLAVALVAVVAVVVVDTIGASRAASSELVVSTTWTRWSDDHVFVAVPGRRPRALALGSAPAVSADGRMIAFVRGGALWVMSSDGSGAHQIAVLGSMSEIWWGDVPVWSPDGQRLAVQLVDAVAIVDIASGSVARLDGATAAAFSSDGAQLAYTTQQGLFVARADGNAAHLVTGDWTDAVGISWSPNDTWIALCALDHGTQVLEGVLHPDGSGEQTFSTGGGGYGSAPAWSRDGRLAWTGYGRLWLATPNGVPHVLATYPDLGWPQPPPRWTGDSRAIIGSATGERFARVSVSTGRFELVHAQGPARQVTSGVSLIGRQIVYSAHSDGGHFQLALERSDGTIIRLLTHDHVDNVDPAWSPGGQAIVFARDGRRQSGIYLMQLASGTVRRLTSGNDRAPAFSPNGQTIAFVRDESLMLMNSNGRQTHAVGVTRALPGQLSWTPDGQTIVYSDGDALQELDIISGTVTPIPLTGNAIRPVVSPDGAQIAFRGYINPNYYRDPNAYGLYTIGIDGQNLHKLATSVYLAPTSWSPDGTVLTATDGYQLYLLPTDGTSPPEPLDSSDNPSFSSVRTNRASFRP